MKQKEPKDLSVTITETQSFAAKIVADEHGGKKLELKSKAWYGHQVNKFRIGEDVTLVIHNRKPKRSEQQNRYYWGVYLPLIAKETGEPNLDRLHELFKGKFLTEGVVEVLGQKVRMKKSTAKLSKAEFSMYIMSIESETGVAAPPTESYGLAPLNNETQNESEDSEEDAE